MTKRKSLAIALVALTFIGLGFTALPFLGYWSPSAKAKAENRVVVPLADIPKAGFAVVELKSYRVFLSRQGSIQAFLFPFRDGAYQLPDPTWERAVVPCTKLSFGSEGIACIDTDLQGSWTEVARWDASGKAIEGNWMPDLRQAPMKVERKHVVIAAQFK